MQTRTSTDDVDRHASKKLAAELRAEIGEERRFAPGSRLPSYRHLAERYGVARNTAQAAVRILQAEGLVVVKPGSGAYVRASTDAAPSDLRSELEEVREQLRQAERALSGLLDRLPAGSIEAPG